MNKEELIKKLEDIEWEDYKMINGWNSHYHLKPLIDGDFDFYKITFPTTTTTTTQKTTQKIIALIEENPKITRKELAEVTGLTEDGIKYHLKKMQDEAIIERIGPDKGGYWEVVRK